MKLLICTQTVDSEDAALGFFPRWIEEFAKHADHVTVVCLRAGKYSLPPNVHVYTLGKGNKITRGYRFIKMSFKLRSRYDTVFVHMNPEYVALAGWMWRLQQKKIALWYAHKSITLKLRIALFFATSICSVTEKSFPLPTPKIHGLGHGIDTALFAQRQHERGDELRLVTVGRIAHSKHEIEMLAVVDLLKEAGQNVTLTIAGDAGTPQERKYKEKLIAEIQRRGLQDDVHMAGALPHASLPALLAKHDVCLNFGTTGNMDKAGFEPLAMGIPLVSTNPAFREILEPSGLYAPLEEAGLIVKAILRAKTIDTGSLMQYTRENHALERLIPKILKTIS
jgi:glycosyltransferase involved in cell wall biosynthesis